MRYRTPAQPWTCEAATRQPVRGAAAPAVSTLPGLVAKAALQPLPQARAKLTPAAPLLLPLACDEVWISRCTTR
jgi:hypothetical protein